MTYNLDHINGPGAEAELKAIREANAAAQEAHSADMLATVEAVKRPDGYVSQGALERARTTGTIPKMTKQVLAVMDAERGK